MPAPLSIVIPTLNAAEALPETLAGLIEGLQAGLLREVVVSDGGSTDATCRVAEAAGAVVISGPAGRGGQLRRGFEQARGRWVLALHADTHLPEGWSAVVAAHMERSERAGYGALSFRSGHPMARVVAGWANLRSRLFGLPYGDQALLISRDLYDTVGGYADVPLMEDVVLARALKGQLTMLPFTVSTSAERYESAGWFKRGARNLTLLTRFAFGADAAALAARYSASSNCKR